MKRQRILEFARAVAVLAAFVGVASRLALGATVQVAANGSDSFGCGSSASPCRTISQAIANANPGDTVLVGPGVYGDVNADGDLADPGEENSGVAGKTIVVSKNLVLVSRDGAGSTVIRTVASSTALSIEASDVALGKKGRGFTVRGASGSTGIAVGAGLSNVTIMGNVVDGHPAALATVDGSNHQIRNNWWTAGFLRVGGTTVLVRDNLFIGGGLVLLPGASGVTIDRNQVQRSTGVGIDLDGTGHTVRRNVVSMGLAGAAFRCQNTCSAVVFQDNIARRNNGHGFEVLSGANHVLTGNLASGNASSGFYFNVPVAVTVTLTRNIAAGNGAAGFTFLGMSDNMNMPVVTNCASVGNQGDGIQVAGYLKVEKSSLYGNLGSGFNCGINKTSALGSVLAQQNYWGASSGPGPDPADQLCGQSAQIDATNPAPSEVKVTTQRNP